MNRKTKNKILFYSLILLWMFGIWIIIAMILSNLDYHNSWFIMIGHNKYFLLSISIITVYFLGWKYIHRCYLEIFKWKRIGMNFLVTLATQISFFFSIYQISMGLFPHLIEVSIFVILFLQTGDLINNKLKKEISNELREITKLQPKNVKVLVNDQIIEKNIKEVEIKEKILVDKNSVIPIDGKLINENALILTQIIDGENQPKTFYKEQNLFAGMQNLDQNLQIEVTKLAKDSLLNQMILKINKIQTAKSSVQNLVDKLLMFFTPVVILFSIFGFLISYFWLNPNDVYLAIQSLITILISACPCAIGIAIPIAIAIGSSKAGKKGVIFNKPDAFQKLIGIKHIAFDKTGTLTEGQVNVVNFKGDSKYLSIIGLIEKEQVHPLATGFLKYLKNNKIKLDENILIKKLSELKYEINNYVYELISLDNLDLKAKSKIDFELEKLENTTSFLLENNEIVAYIEFIDNIRLNAFKSLEKLKKQKYNLIMITGDNQKVANKVGLKLGITQIFANQKANDKYEIIKSYQDQKEKVVFVGDGANDILAIQQSDLSISIISPTSYLSLDSDISLINPDISLIVNAIYYTKKTRNIIFSNLFWAFAYNFTIIPLAMFGIISPMIGMIVMFCSTLLVLLNSLIFKIAK